MRNVSVVKLVAVVITAFVVFIGSAEAQTPSTPVLVTTYSSGGTLGIPRWKGYMSPTDPNKFWVCFANGGSSSNNMCCTTNAGDTWSSNTIGINGYMDFHLALSGSGNDLYFTFPVSVSNAISFRHFRAPAESTSDADPMVKLSGTSAHHRSSIMVQNTGRIWVFTRLGGTTGENVRYQYSDNGGTTWTTGMAFSTAAPDTRIGSMPYVNSNPALVVLHLNDSRGYEYHIQKGAPQAHPGHRRGLCGHPDRCRNGNNTNDTVALHALGSRNKGGGGHCHRSSLSDRAGSGPDRAAVGEALDEAHWSHRRTSQAFESVKCLSPIEC
jgi:hypothetical protein